MASILRSLVNESRVSAAREWLQESFHLQFDDAIKMAGVALFFHGDEIAALVFAASAMLLSLALLLLAHKAAVKHSERPAKMTASEVAFDNEMRAMLASR